MKDCTCNRCLSQRIDELIEDCGSVEAEMYNIANRLAVHMHEPQKPLVKAWRDGTSKRVGELVVLRDGSSLVDAYTAEHRYVVDPNIKDKIFVVVGKGLWKYVAGIYQKRNDLEIVCLDDLSMRLRTSSDHCVSVHDSLPHEVTSA